jgi:hypothetical protein
MATDARDVLPVLARPANAGDDVLVTLEAGALGDIVVSLRNVDFVRKSLRGECERMEEAVECLSAVLANQAGRRMAVIADRDLPVA